MAKKIENTANQGNQYMKNLLGDREIVPLGASAESMTAEPSTPAAAETLHPVSAAAVQPQPAPIPQTSQQPYYPQPGMPYYNPPYTPRKETKMRASFTILPSDFKKLKRIAYMNRITIKGKRNISTNIQWECNTRCCPFWCCFRLRTIYCFF